MSSDAPWLDIAKQDLAAGVKRLPGKAAHPRIIEYFDNVGLAHTGDDDQSYCGAGMGTWLKESGFPVPKGAYGAKTFETYGKRLDEFVPGCICVFYRTALRERDWKRHVTIGLRETKTHIECLGANQAGGAVTISKYPKKDLVPGAMRWPVAATVKDLRDAGSTEIKLSDDLVKAGGGAVVTGVGGAAAKEALQTPAEVPIKEAIEYSGLMQQIMEGAQGVWKMVIANPWLVMAVVGGGIALVLARRVRKARVARAAAGAEISSQVTGAG